MLLCENRYLSHEKCAVQRLLHHRLVLCASNAIKRSENDGEQKYVVVSVENKLMSLFFDQRLIKGRILWTSHSICYFVQQISTRKMNGISSEWFCGSFRSLFFIFISKYAFVYLISANFAVQISVFESIAHIDKHHCIGKGTTSDDLRLFTHVPCVILRSCEYYLNDWQMYAQFGVPCLFINALFC